MAKKRTLIETLEIKDFGLANAIERFLAASGYDIDAEIQRERCFSTLVGMEGEIEPKSIIKVYEVEEINKEKDE